HERDATWSAFCAGRKARNTLQEISERRRRLEAAAAAATKQAEDAAQDAAARSASTVDLKDCFDDIIEKLVSNLVESVHGNLAELFPFEFSIRQRGLQVAERATHEVLLERQFVL